MPTSVYSYVCYGHKITANISIPGFHQVANDGDRDLYIELRTSLPTYPKGQLLYSSIHESKAEQGSPLFNFFCGNDVYSFSYPGIADYVLFPADNHIVVCPAAAANYNEVLYFLIKGAVLILWLNFLGIVTLHSSVVNISGKAVGFIGHSMSGKSTLAANFIGHDCRFISDDILAIRKDFIQGSHVFEVLPSMPVMKIRDSSILPANLGLNELSVECPGKKERIYEILNYERDCWSPVTLPLSSLYFIERVGHHLSRPKIEINSKRDTLFNLIACSQGLTVFEKLGFAQQRLELLACMLNHITVASIKFNSGRFQMNPVIELVKEHT